MDNTLFITVLASHPKNKILLLQMRILGLIIIPLFVYYSLVLDRPHAVFYNLTFMEFITIINVMNVEFILMQVYLQGTRDRVGFSIVLKDMKEISLSTFTNFDVVLTLAFLITPLMALLNEEYYVQYLILWDVSFILILLIAFQRGISIANKDQKQSAVYTRYILIFAVVVVAIKQIALLPVSFIPYQPVIQGVIVVLVFMLGIAVMLLRNFEEQYFKLKKVEKYEKLLNTDSKVGNLSIFLSNLPTSMIRGKNYLKIASYCMIIVGIPLYLAITNIPENTDVFTSSWASIAFYAFILMGILLIISLYLVVKTLNILTIHMIQFDRIMYNFEMTNKEYLEILEEHESYD